MAARTTYDQSTPEPPRNESPHDFSDSEKFEKFDKKTAMDFMCADVRYDDFECFLADRSDHFVPDPSKSKLTTLNKSQKEMLKESDDKVRGQGRAMWSALSGYGPSSSAKLLFVIASCMTSQAASLGQSAHLIDPGLHANRCSYPMVEEMKKAVELHNPSVIFANVS